MSLFLAQRYETVFLKLHSLRPKMSNKAISKHVGFSLPTMAYWLNRWQDSEDLSDIPVSGRPRATSEKTDSKTVSTAKNEQNVTSDDIANKLEKTDLNIDARTIRRRLMDSGGSYGSPLAKSLLTEDHLKDRLRTDLGSETQTFQME